MRTEAAATAQKLSAATAAAVEATQQRETAQTELDRVRLPLPFAPLL